MLYRVVMQGHTLGGADVAVVKQHFVRVTGLPAGVAEELFGGMPQVIKRQLSQTDAERIAATLRAIGAAAIVERELVGTEEETSEGIRVVAAPLNAGPPTVIPGSVALPVGTPVLSWHARLLRTMRANLPLVIGGAALVVGAILLFPVADELVRNLRHDPAPVPVAPKRTPAPDPAPSAPVMNATLLHGPWRCVDQRTGASTYWSYGEDGALIFHGDVLSDRPPPPAIAASAPTGWKLDGQRLFHTFAQRAPDTYTVSDLSLARLRYGNERGLDIQCRRP
jgi:hypothetical protein